MWDFMFFFNSALLGVGLAMDAFSVSLANGLNEPLMKKRRMCGISGVFSFFQFAMPNTTIKRSKERNKKTQEMLLLNIENAKNEGLQHLSKAKEEIEITQERLSFNIETAKNEGIQHFDEINEKNHKKLMNGIYIAIGISTCAAILSLIGLFL